MTRDVASRVHAKVGDVFVIPEGKIQKENMLISATDGQKMSKSYNNYINIFLPEKDLLKVVKTIVTDTTPLEEPKNPDDCNIFALHLLITSEPELSKIREGYLKGGLGYGDSKKILLRNYLNFIAPMVERRKYYQEHPELVNKILSGSAQKIREKIIPLMHDVREKIGLL